MHFNKYDDFIKENKETKLRKKAENIRKDIEKLQQKLKKASSEKNTQKEAKFKKKIEELTSEVDALVGYANQISGKTEEIKKDSKKESDSTDSNSSEKEKTNDTTDDTTDDTTNDDAKKKEEVEPEEKPEDKKEKVSNQGTNGVEKNDFSKMTPDKLNDRLTDWNDKYAQAFKFENDMPKSPTGNLSDLISVISEDKKTLAKEAIQQICKFFKNPSFNNQDIEISGYTSTTGSDSYNKSLSDRRAESVLNAIESEMKDKGINTKINFTTIGHGEDKKHLLILNDTENGTPDTIKKGNGVSIKDEVLSKIDTPEKRQQLNRRVEIILKKFSPVKREIGSNTPINNTELQKTEVDVEKPISPNPESLEFNYDSYILTKESESLLESFATDIKKWNSNKEGEEKIKTIYISSHTLKGYEPDEKDEKEQIEKLFILSTNRAYTVKRYLQIKIGEDISKDINFFLYPVSSNMGEEKKVEIHFDESKHMQEAKKVFERIAPKYNVDISKRGYGGKNYVINKVLRDGIIYNLKGYAKNGIVKKKIPLELWYIKGRFGLGLEEKITDFQEELKQALRNSKKSTDPKDYVYTSI